MLPIRNRIIVSIVSYISFLGIIQFFAKPGVSISPGQYDILLKFSGKFFLFLFSPSGMLIHIPHVRYFEEHLHLPLFQRALVDLPTDKFHLIQERGMLIREVMILRDICS